MSQPLTFFSERIVIDPAICNGKPTVKGTRITVQSVLEYLAAGDTEADILAHYPQLGVEDIQACVACAAHLMQSGYEVARAA